MPYSIRYDAGEHLIIVTHQGVLDPEMVSAIIAQAIPLVMQHHCFHVLEDVREAQIRFPTINIYNIPTIVSQELSPFEMKGYQFKRAIVARKEDWEDLSFYETVSVNQAQTVKLFLEIEEAKKWLAEK